MTDDQLHETAGKLRSFAPRTIEGLSPKRRAENPDECSMRRGAALPSSQLGLTGALGAPSPSIGRSSSSTPCRLGREACAPCRHRIIRSIVEVRSLGVPAHAQRFATFGDVVRGCTYASSVCIEIGYMPSIGQARCIHTNAFFLIRRSNNSGGTRRARRPRAGQRGACHGRGGTRARCA